jgi:hypothetical protein
MTSREELAKKSVSELLDLLEPIPEPPPISFFPATPVWGFVVAVVLVVLLLAAWRMLRRHRANAYRRAALAELRRIENDAGAQAALLRRTALAAFPRHDVASLIGDEWLAFLDEAEGGKAFRSSLGRALMTAAYSRSSELGRETNPIVARWIRRHGNDRPGAAA